MQTTIKDFIATGSPEIIRLRRDSVQDKFFGITIPRIEKRYLTQVILTTIPLLISDLLASVGICFISISLYDGSNFSTQQGLLSLLPVLVLIFILVYLMFGLYPGSGLSPIYELRQIVVSTTLIFFGFFAFSFALQDLILSELVLVTWILSIFTVPVFRSVTRRIFARFKWWGQPIIIIGGEEAKHCYNYLADRPYFGLKPIGNIGNPSLFPYLGNLDRASSIANDFNVYWAVITMSKRSNSSAYELINTYLKDFPHILLVPTTEGLPSLWNRTFDLGKLHGIRIQSNLLLPLPRFLKRVVDLLIVFFLGITCLPLIILISFLVKMSSRGAVFYGQERISYKGIRFNAWKFRTMYRNSNELLAKIIESDSNIRDEWEKNHKLRNDPRVTPIGKWLRKTSLDELPQLWNILRGQMSMVGPRPIVKEEIPRYGKNYSLYLRAVPGLTGLWQISGRNNTTYAERVYLDCYYVKNWSPWMDIYILARTIKIVLFCEGAY